MLKKYACAHSYAVQCSALTSIKTQMCRAVLMQCWLTSCHAPTIRSTHAVAHSENLKQMQQCLTP